MAKQRYILQFVSDPSLYMDTCPGGKRWAMVSEHQAKQFTYLQAVKYAEKYPGRFNIEPSMAAYTF